MSESLLFFFFFGNDVLQQSSAWQRRKLFCKELENPYVLLISISCFVFSPIFSLYFLWHPHQARGNRANSELYTHCPASICVLIVGFTVTPKQSRVLSLPYLPSTNCHNPWRKFARCSKGGQEESASAPRSQAAPSPATGVRRSRSLLGDTADCENLSLVLGSVLIHCFKLSDLFAIVYLIVIIMQ